MLRTRLTDLFGIEVPIIQAAVAPYTSAELVAAVSNAGGLGSVGTALTSPDAVMQTIARTRALTARPFIVNFTLTMLDEELFRRVLAERPAVISLALGDPGDLVARAHDAGARVIQQIHTVAQAREAAARGVDALIAQGSEAGGFGGVVATMPLLPQVVDAVEPLPVIAAGGIADGRGLAAALTLGAAGVNIGTRFLATQEAPVDAGWKQTLLGAASEDAIKVDVINDIFPPRPGGYAVAPRALRSPFVEQWQARRDEAQRESERLRGELLAAHRENRLTDYVGFAGQTAGAIHDIAPAAEIVRRLVAEAEEALERANGLRVDRV